MKAIQKIYDEHRSISAVLHGLKQLPGIAVQRLMEQGYGFGAEGDWKTAALVQTMKVMAEGMPGGTSFIGMDGRVIHWNSREPGPAVELTDPQMVASVVVEFAAMHNLPELAQLS